MLRFRLKDRLEVPQCACHLVRPGLGPLLCAQGCGFVDTTGQARSSSSDPAGYILEWLSPLIRWKTLHTYSLLFGP